MRTIMGRPKLPKDRAKAVLIGARFSPPEANQVDQAVKLAGQGRSEWVRKTLLFAAVAAKSAANGTKAE